MLSTGCQWGYVPKDLPPPPAIRLASRSGTFGRLRPRARSTNISSFGPTRALETIHHALYMKCGEQIGRS